MDTESNLDEWDTLSKAQQQGLLDAIAEFEAGLGIPSEIVMKEMRKKYSPENN